jgi:hypothetical protein
VLGIVEGCRLCEGPELGMDDGDWLGALLGSLLGIELGALEGN